jgi:hypothetical protein
VLNTDTLLKKLLDTHDDVATQTGLVAAELKRLNDNLEKGVLNIRTHHPLCIALPGNDPSLSDMEAASSFLAAAIKSGALVLPGKNGGSNVEPAEAGGQS